MRRFLQFTLSLCLMFVALAAKAESPYTLTYDKAAELLKLVKNGCTSYDATYMGQATLEGYDGFFSFNPADPDWTLMGNTCIAAYVALPDGDYTLKVPAGVFKFDGVENEAIEIPFTVGEKQQGGGGDTGNFDGEKWQETIFTSGETSVTVPVVFDTEGMTLTTEGREFMGMTIDVAYNTYDENEIDWNNGTKIIITAKDNISGIVMEGNFLQFASADKGTYNNGAWTGALMKGDVLTLTANDGIHIKKMVVLYNGDEYENEGGESQEGVITIQYPTPNMAWATFNNGNKLATFTTNKEYAQVIIDVKDLEPNWDNGNYDFPTRMVDNAGEKSDNLHVGENTITALTPDAKPWNFYKGHTYKMIVRGYVNMWDQADAYDAIAEVTFIGDGTEAPAISDITLDKIFPANGIALPEGPRTVDLTFSAPVKTLKAVQPMGMGGSTNYTCTKVDEEGLIWTVDLGSLKVDSEQGDESTISLEISGTDMNDAVLNLGDNAARALQLQYTISKTATEPEDEVDVQIVPSFLDGEEEIALNDHSAVSVAKAEAIKVGFGDNAAKIKYATYSISELVEEEFMGQTDVVEIDIASGNLNINTFGYAQFEETLQFPTGHKYNVKIKAWDSEDIFTPDFNIKDPIATFECEFNGAYSEESGAALIVDGEVIALSTEEATEFGELPAGSVFKYVVTKEDTKTVQFQIYDETAGEMLKTMVMKQDANGLAGTVEFVLPLKYDLAKGHSYEAQFKEYNAVNGLTIKQPTAEVSYKFAGIADVAVYSTVKVASIAPSTSTDIDDLDTPVTITFTDAIASLDVTAVIGQMTAVAVDTADITSNEDKTVWTVALKESYVSSGTIQLNFYAIDNEGNRVTDPNDGVGTPEDCYVNYAWATAIGLPTPTLAEDGKTYESILAITFENEGIGLNEDNTTATWNQISVEKDGEPMDITITEDMFEVAGDSSVGGTKLVFTFPAALYKGVYTVNVPARAFMLGHDIDNTYNGACSFTFTCTAEEKEPELADGTYYIQNVESGLFMAGNNSWGTQASAVATGDEFAVTLADGVYTITGTSLTSSNKTLGYNLFVDTNVSQNGNTWTIAPVEGEEGVYTIYGKGKKDNTENAFDGYIAQSETAGAVAGYVLEGVAEITDAAKWRFVTKADLTAEIAAGDDVTYLISNANFTRNHATSAWIVDEGCTNKNLGGGENSNFCAESYHSAFNIHQTIENAPNGFYTLTAQGFYRNDFKDGEEHAIPVFYANSEEIAIPVKTGEENSMSDASRSFTKGLYTIDPIQFEVTDGTITIGVKSDEAEYWCIWDNFQLTYLGEEAPAEIVVTLIADSTEYTLNTHSNVTIDQPISAIKVAGLDQVQDSVTYAIYGMDKATLAAGLLSVNTIGYAEFAPVTLYEGNQYNVVVTVGENTVFDQIVIGAAEPAEIEIAATINDSIALNTHSAISAESIKTIEVSFEGFAPTQAGYSINTLVQVADSAAEASSWEIGETLAQGVLSLNGKGYAELEEAIVLNAGTKYCVIINADNQSATFEINGAYEKPNAISSIATASKSNGKYIENGKVVIVKNGVKYNVAGSVIK